MCCTPRGSKQIHSSASGKGPAGVRGSNQMSPSLASGKGLGTKWWYHLYLVKVRGQGTYNNITYLAYLQHHQQLHCYTYNQLQQSVK
jgi:hypothetical protein